MEELGYTSKFDGETTDNILDNAKAIMDQTTAEDGDTVQVYDTDGVPHKIAKEELLKKSALALPKLEDISSFVAINAAGNAIGLMTKEQVASVVGGLLGNGNASKTGLLSDTVYRRRLQYFSVSNGAVMLVAKLNYKYGGIYVHGFNGGTGELFNFAVMMKVEGTNAYIVGELGNSEHPIKVYRDDDNNIYIEGETGADCQGWIEISDRTDNNIVIQATTLPSGATRLYNT